MPILEVKHELEPGTHLEFINEDNSKNTGIMAMSEKAVQYLQDFQQKLLQMPKVQELYNMTFDMPKGQAYIHWKRNSKPNSHVQIQIFKQENGNRIRLHEITIHVHYPLEILLPKEIDGDKFSYRLETFMNCLVLPKYAIKAKLYLRDEIISDGPTEIKNFGIFKGQIFRA